MTAGFSMHMICAPQDPPELREIDAADVRDLIAQTGVMDDLLSMPIDWTDLFPFWLAAKDNDAMLGAIQVTPGKPIGRLELLCVKQDLPHQQRGEVIKALIETGTEVLRGQGSYVVTGMVSHEDKGFKRAYKKRGWRPVLVGTTLGKALNGTVRE